MPPKKTSAPKEHNVYIITHHKIGDNDEVGHMEIFQAHSTLNEANANAEAKVNDLCATMGIDTPETTAENYTKDHNFNIRVPLSKGSFTVEVVTQPLLGGTITPSKAPAKTAAPKKATPKKTKSKTPPTDDEEDDDDEVNGDEEDDKPVTNGKKRKAESSADEDEDEEGASAHDIHAAPSGAKNCLNGMSFLVTGTLEDWTRDQIYALIKTFGGTTEKTLKTSLSYVVIGIKPGEKKLNEISQKGLKTITQTGLYQLIRDSPGGETISSEEVALACKRAKGKTAAAAKANKAAKKDN